MLVVLLAVLLVAFGTQFHDSSAYPATAEIDAEYADHTGEQVHLWGRVTAANDERGVVFAAGPLELTLTNVSPATVDVGVRVQVYGELRSGRRMTVTRVVAARPDSRRWMYGISVVGIGVATVAFLRQWRFDTDELAFVPREEPVRFDRTDSSVGHSDQSGDNRADGRGDGDDEISEGGVS